MKKRWLSLVIANVLVIGFIGCGSDDEVSEDKENSQVVIDENNPPSEPIHPYQAQTPPSVPTQTN